ncbi:hypothetical protein IT570_09445 [Candidatus Sumerlaeota bacterium]|nr:hypothetical protein [Candidatus Sumerlaeota bacterium]
MTISLSLKGTYKKAAFEDSMKYLARLSGALNNYAEDMIKDFHTDFQEENYIAYGKDGEARLEKKVAMVQLAFHPAAQPVMIALFHPNHIVVNAETAGVGPGYHQYLCDMFKAAALPLKITWDIANSSDPTGYFANANRSALESVFLRWLGDQCADLQDLYGRGERQLSLALPTLDRFPHDGAVATPLGPRPASWLDAVCQEPSRGKDMFAWWDAGEGGNYYLGRALSHLWLQARFRQPMTEGETASYADMLNCLEEAYKLAPQLRYPWREWDDFLRMTDRNDHLTAEVGGKADAESGARPLFGYRRGDYISVFPSGWHVTLPGVFAEQFGEGGMWTGWDDSRTVQIGTITAPPNGDGSLIPAAEIIRDAPPLGMGRGEDYERNEEGLISKGNLHQANEDNRIFWRLGTASAVDGNMLVVTINFDNEEDKDWAMEVWKSIYFSPPQ